MNGASAVLSYSPSGRRLSYRFLCIAPFIAVALAGPRPLHIDGFRQGAGAVVFLAMAFAVWSLGFRNREGTGPDVNHASAGTFLFAPFALIALMWVGLGTPWDATPPENVMRYSVLLASAVAVTIGFHLAGSLLVTTGAPYAPIGSAANLLAGAGYVVWISFQLGAHAQKAATGIVPEAIRAMDGVLDTLLFAACALTYLAAAAFARAMLRASVLGRTGATVFVLLNLVALVFLTVRGLSFPDPTKGATAWYLRPGFIAGIPAIPWLMPALMGVVLLRHAASRTAR